MGGIVATVVGGMDARRRAWRRARNLRAAARPARAPAKGSNTTMQGAAGGSAPGGYWPGWCALALAIGGALLIAGHARSLGAVARPQAAGAVRTLAAFQPALPGVAFAVPAAPGVSLDAQPGGALLILSGMRAERPVVIDLCEQMLGGGTRLATLRIGGGFADLARLVARNEGAASPATLRNVVLASGSMPRIEIGGNAGGAMRLAWHGGPAARWVGEGGAILRGAQGSTAFGSGGWLVWGAADALRLARRASAACPRGGELVLTRYRAGPAQSGAEALVAAFPERGGVQTARLAPGDYRIPAEAPAALEDGALFERLLARGLVRLNGAGMVEVAPRDLAEWRQAGTAARAIDLHGWDGVRLDDSGRRLLERLHGRADGAYVREQIRVFNGEQRLLAWRLQPGDSGNWQAAVDSVAVPVDGGLPLAGARLFDRLPQGWGPWQRVSGWPGSAATARLSLALPAHSSGVPNVPIALLLAGRVTAVEGATLGASEGLCRGRACTGEEDVRALRLLPLPGARRIVVEAAPLDLARMGGGDAAYRHLVLDKGRLAWQPLPRPAPAARAMAAPVVLADRTGIPLWQDGHASPAARSAGLATLLGLRADHGSSIAGMLARLPSANGAPHAARLTLDLGLQGAAQAALDCAGMRGGSWDGARCHGGLPASAVPARRQAGMVLLDTASGDILAAASAGTARPEAADWSEVRDFDRVDPARSPLRQAALQHDGGAERSPGSTFKIVTALGLELAAQRDPRLDALLDGMPLPAINALAGARGFAFRTDAATYPLVPAGSGQGARAHITNFREQHLERRAEDGRLGLAQALAHSLNTWFAWTGELSDASLFGRAEGGAPSLRALDAGALAGVRPVHDMAQRLGFEQPLRLDGGLLPDDYAWRDWDALAPSTATFDPVRSRHELRQMAIGLRMQATPLQMALAAGAVGEGRAIAPRLLLTLDARTAVAAPGAPLGVRLDRIRAGLRGVVAHGTAAAAFRDPAFDRLRSGLYGKTGTAPVGTDGQATVWFSGWLEPGSLPGQDRRLAFAAFVSRSEGTGGGHAAPVVAGLLRALLARQPAPPSVLPVRKGD